MRDCREITPKTLKCILSFINSGSVSHCQHVLSVLFVIFILFVGSFIQGFVFLIAWFWLHKSAHVNLYYKLLF